MSACGVLNKLPKLLRRAGYRSKNQATSLVEAQDRYSSGELPGFIRAEFERYLRCGLRCHGFARVRCSTCHEELVVAFSCKNGVSVHHALGDGCLTLRRTLPKTPTS